MDGKSVIFEAGGETYAMRFDIAALHTFEELSKDGLPTDTRELPRFMAALVTRDGRKIDEIHAGALVLELGFVRTAQLMADAFTLAFPDTPARGPLDDRRAA